MKGNYSEVAIHRHFVCSILGLTCSHYRLLNTQGDKNFITVWHGLWLIPMSVPLKHHLWNRPWISDCSHPGGSLASYEHMPQWSCLQLRTWDPQIQWCQHWTCRSPAGPKGSGCHRSSSLCPGAEGDVASGIGVREEERTGVVSSPHQVHCAQEDPWMLILVPCPFMYHLGLCTEISHSSLIRLSRRKG